MNGCKATAAVTGPSLGRRWRLAFPPDGAALFVLEGPFDRAAAMTLRNRIEELTAEARLGLVLDLSAAGELDAGQQGRLLRIVATATLASPVAAVMRNPEALHARIFTAHRELRLWPVPTRVDARLALDAAAPPRAAGDGPLAPTAGGDLAARRRRAVGRSLRWAARSAAMGDYADALGWLELVEAVDGGLPPGWSERRRSWERGRHHVPV
ncbi:hypothetical protein [Conexibacter arvalis]|uniref:STAS domain-containing protein n=1 Tax=Conexibacter arvalis TaxID=912552 RepID=A0A840I759_9ACTN|nr:hypothetical protein [Conexibacter arvalis]MBB4660719.1 hypothetical protein [Conexibacter arvalis]